MKLGTAHELGLAAATTLALLSVLLGGALPAWSWLALLAPAVSAYLHLRQRPVAGWLGTALAATALLYGVSVLLSQGLQAALLAGALSLGGILCARLLTRSSMSHDLQALLIALLLLFSGAGLDLQITYGLVFVAFAVSATWALTTRQLIAGATAAAVGVDPSQPASGPRSPASAVSRRDVATPTFFAVTGLTAVGLLLGTSLLFTFFPRVGFGNLGIFARRFDAFPADVSLEGPPRASLGGSTVLARVWGVRFAQFERGLYLRGAVYDAISRSGFEHSRVPGTLPRSLLRLAPGGESQRYEVFSEPLRGRLLGSLGHTSAAQILSGGGANPSMPLRVAGLGPSGEIRTSRPLTGPVRYAVYGEVAPLRQLEAAPPPPPDGPPRPTPLLLDHYLKLPPHIDPRIVPLARRVVGQAQGAAAKATRLRQFLLHNFTYALDQANSSKPDPLASFLFDDRRGHCEYFATAFATLLRAVGVASRVVGGLQGGTWDNDGKVVVFTSKNAHAWVEWYEPGRGWVVDDATPAANAPPAILRGVAAWIERVQRFWDNNVVDYGLDQQVALLRGLMGKASGSKRHHPWRGGLRTLLISLAAALGLGALALWRRWRPRQSKRLSPLARALLDASEKLAQHPTPPDWTVREAVQHALQQPGASPSHELLQAALGAYERDRFGNRPLSAPQRRTLRRRLRRLPS